MVLDWVPRLVPEHEERGAGLKERTSWRLGHRAGGAAWGLPAGGCSGLGMKARMKRMSLANTTLKAQIKTSQAGRQGFTA